MTCEVWVGNDQCGQSATWKKQSTAAQGRWFLMCDEHAEKSKKLVRDKEDMDRTPK